MVGLEKKDDKLAVPFVVAIGYNPSIAQINLKGQAIIFGSQDEIEKILEDHKKQTHLRNCCCRR